MQLVYAYLEAARHSQAGSTAPSTPPAAAHSLVEQQPFLRFCSFMALRRRSFATQGLRGCVAGRLEHVLFAGVTAGGEKSAFGPLLFGVRSCITGGGSHLTVVASSDGPGEATGRYCFRSFSPSSLDAVWEFACNVNA